MIVIDIILLIYFHSDILQLCARIILSLNIIETNCRIHDIMIYKFNGYYFMGGHFIGMTDKSSKFDENQLIFTKKKEMTMPYVIAYRGKPISS